MFTVEQRLEMVRRETVGIAGKVDQSGPVAPDLVAAMCAVFWLRARDAPRPQTTKPAPGMFAALSVFRTSGRAWALTLFYFMAFGGFVAMAVFLPKLLRDWFDISLTDAGLRAAGFTVIATFARPVGGWLSDRIGPATVLIVVFIGAGLDATWLALVSGDPTWVLIVSGSGMTKTETLAPLGAVLLQEEQDLTGKRRTIGYPSVGAGLLLRFVHALGQGLENTEVFVFGTRLTRITRELRKRDVDTALTQVVSSVEDWSGGTRIGEAIKTFNYQWARRVLRSGATTETLPKSSHLQADR